MSFRDMWGIFATTFFCGLTTILFSVLFFYKRRMLDSLRFKYLEKVADKFLSVEEDVGKTGSGNLENQDGDLIGRRKKLKSTIAVVVILLFAVSAYGVFLYGFSLEYISMMLLASYLGSVTITDFNLNEIPDSATVLFGVCFILFKLIFFSAGTWLNSLLGFVSGAGILLGIHFIRHDSIGFGDIKMFACIGVLVGFPEVWFVLFRATILGTIFSLGLLLLKKGTLKTELPFAPFVFIAAMI